MIAPKGSQWSEANPTRHFSSTQSPLSNSGSRWTRLVSAPCDFSLSVFISTLKTLSLHPEKLFQVVLRGDILPLHQSSISDRLFKGAEDGVKTAIPGLELVERIRTRLVPNQPQRYSKLDQTSSIYRFSGHPEITPQENSDITTQNDSGLVIFTPEVNSIEQIPYYYPQVNHIAFLWDSSIIDDSSEEGTEVRARISVHYLQTKSPSWTSHAPTDAQLHLTHPAIRGMTSRLNKPKRRSPLATVSQESDVDRSQKLGVVDRSQLESDGMARSTKELEDDLYKQCQHLLEKIFKYCQFANSPVLHPKNGAVRPPESFESLYLLLQDRHRHLNLSLSKTDMVKHRLSKLHATPSDDSGIPANNVSEWGRRDVAVAAYLMLLWKDMYPERPNISDKGKGEDVRKWDTWGRPEGGFVDLGCGNGLLVHVLISEGYIGKGYDLRPRPSWNMYPTMTKDALVKQPLDLPAWFPHTEKEWELGSWPMREECVVRDGIFIIGNHCDELTPWLPLLSIIPSPPVPYISLPCCLHTLDSIYSHVEFAHSSQWSNPSILLPAELDPTKSVYDSYIAWLGWCSSRCGWEWDIDKVGHGMAFDKGWAIIGKRG
nr:tRNA (uracil-O(2)-)-methyltransferase [Cryptococcus tetragattii IND107]